MEKAAPPDAWQIALEQTLMPFLKGVAWATLEWGVFAIIFLPLFVWIVRAATSRQAAITRVAVVGIVFLAAVGIADFWKSFGEAFAGGTNRYRTPTWFCLTAVAIILAATEAWRTRRKSP
jgi:hypothetical protein